MKRWMARLISLCMILTLLPGTAGAAESGMAHFTTVRTYDGRFSDADPGDWYYDNVVMLFELGLTEGQSDTRFGADSEVTLAETVSFAARIYSTYHAGDPAAGPSAYTGGTWYEPSVAYLQAEGILDDRFAGRYGESTTRAEMAWILDRLLPEAELPEYNRDLVTRAVESGCYVTDVTVETEYAGEILNLYYRGIAAGSDGYGRFYPETGITRSEFAAMLTRLVEPDLRVILTWNVLPAYSAEGTTWTDLYTWDGVIRLSHPVDDFDAAEQNFLQMLRSGENEVELHYDAGTFREEDMKTLLNLYLNVSVRYPEAGGNSANISWNSRGDVTITFDNPAHADRNAALEAAIAIHDQLWEDGAVTAQMTDREKAWVYCQWICDHCSYDNRFSQLSYTANGVFEQGTAVCQGYTAAYHLLLRLEGMEPWAAVTEDHMWTAVTLGGEERHIDVTWADQSYGVEQRYFDMSPETAWSRPEL